MPQFLRMLILALLVLPLFSCGEEVRVAKKRSDGRVEVEFWHAMSRAQGASLNNIIDEFNKSQDKYFVLGVYQGNYNALSQKLIASLYAGRNPAASQLYESWAARSLRYGYLQPVEHFLEKEPEYRAALEADLFPAFLENQKLYDPKAGRQVLATLPFNKSVYMWMVNQKRMSAAGYEHGPKTWDEWLKMVSDMTSRDANGAVETFGFAARDNIESLTVNLFMADTNYLDEKENVTFNGPDGIASLQLLYDMAKGKDNIGYIESGYLNDAFGKERCASYIGSTASYTFNDSAVGAKFVWRAYELPARDEKSPGSVLTQGTNVGIFSNVSEEEQAGAWEFLKYVSEGEMLVRWCIETGYMPTRKSALEDPKMAKYLEDNVNYANAVESLDRLMSEPKPIYWDSCRAILDRAVQAALTGNKTVEQAVADAAVQIEDIVKSTRVQDAEAAPTKSKERASN